MNFKYIPLLSIIGDNAILNIGGIVIAIAIAVVSVIVLVLLIPKEKRRK